MALEDLTGTGKFVSSLNAAWPVDDDWVDEGDNHIRGIKNVLKNTFPATDGAVYWSGAQARFPDGSAGAPGISWVNETTSGWYRSGLNVFSFSVGGGEKLRVGWEGVDVIGQARFSDGTVAAPAMSFTNDPNTGFYRALEGTPAVSCNGVAAQGWEATRTVIYSGGVPVLTVNASKTVKATSNNGASVFPANIHEFTSDNADLACLGVVHTNVLPRGIQFYYANASPRNAANNFLMAADSTGTLFQMFSNGGLANYSANNVNMSDVSVKRDIVPAPDHTAFVERLKFKRFSYAEQPNMGEVDGVIAQDIAALDGTLVTTGFEDKLGVYEQRVQQRINSVIPRLIERIKALEAKLAFLEAGLAGH